MTGSQNWPMHPLGWNFDGSIDRVAHHFATATVTDDFGERYVIRRCGHCRKWMRRTTDNFGPRARHPNGSVKRWDGWCRTCRSQAARRYYAQTPAQRIKAQNRAKSKRLRSDPVWLARRRASNAAYMRARRAADPELGRQAHRRWYLKQKADERKWQEYLAKARERYRQRHGRSDEPEPIGFVRGSSGRGPTLPLTPLVEALRRFERRTPSWWTDIEYSEILGVSDRTLREWRSGTRKVVRSSVADRVLIGMDLLWFDVWAKPANGRANGRPQDVLRYISEAEAYGRASMAFEGELVE